MALKPFHLLPLYWRSPQAKQLMYWQDAAKHFMMLKPRDAAWRTEWRPHDCRRAGEAQTPTSALSVGRFCLMRGHAPHPIQVMCCSLHVQQHMTARTNFGHISGWEGEHGDICSWVHLVLIFYLKMHVSPFVSFFSLRYCAQPKEEQSCVPARGCVWSGSRLFSASRPRLCSEGLLFQTHALFY